GGGTFEGVVGHDTAFVATLTAGIGLLYAGFLVAERGRAGGSHSADRDHGPGPPGGRRSESQPMPGRGPWGGLGGRVRTPSATARNPRPRPVASCSSAPAAPPLRGNTTLRDISSPITSDSNANRDQATDGVRPAVDPRSRGEARPAGGSGAQTQDELSEG